MNLKNRPGNIVHVDKDIIRDCIDFGKELVVILIIAIVLGWVAIWRKWVD